MNHPKDVVIVQQLLNGHIQRAPCRRPMKVDGKWSPALERAITTFQQLAGGPVMTEGRMEPGTRMFRMLLQPPAIFGFERRMAQRMRPAPATSTIEVFIFDGLPRLTSLWGHAALDVDGHTFSRATTKYAVLERERYLASNLQEVKRDVIGLVLRVSQDEKSKIKSELERRVAAQKPYSITDNSCSTNVWEVLEMVGILAHDPRFQIVPSSARMVSPKELLIVLSRSSRLVKRNYYKRAS